MKERELKNDTVHRLLDTSPLDLVRLARRSFNSPRRGESEGARSEAEGRARTYAARSIPRRTTLYTLKVIGKKLQLALTHSSTGRE